MAQKSIKSRLNDYHLKATPQRISVYDALLHLGHASADMILEYVNSGSERIAVTPASVYNILARFEAKGLCQKRSGYSGKVFYHLGSGSHAVLYDTKNDEFKDIDDVAIVQAVTSCLKGRRFRGYKLETVDVRLICHSTRRILINKK